MNAFAARLPLRCTCKPNSRRKLAIQANRWIAWLLVVSPPVQWAAGVRFRDGLVFDLALLLVHGVASLVLFGLPKTEESERWKLWAGLRPRSLSRRGAFLLSGWRIALAAPYTLASFVGPLGWALWLPTFWLWIRLPFGVMGHLAEAVTYALRRWGVRDENDAFMAGATVAGVFAACSTVNLFR